MSERSFRRHQARCIAREERRTAVRRRRAGLVTGVAALGVTALGAPAAQADTFEVNSLADGAATECDDTCTLRDAIEGADSAVGADTVTFRNTLSGTIALIQAQGELVAGSGDDVTIDGPGASALTVEAASGRRVISFSGAGKSTLSGLTLSGGDVGPFQGGGTVFNNADLTIADSAVTGGQAKYGGGIATRDSLTLTGSTVTGNTAQRFGGGIAASYAGDVHISDSTIAGNSGTLGGGLAFKYTNAGEATIDHTTIRDNTATVAAGLFVTGVAENVPVTVSASTLSGNTATEAGGAIALYRDIRSPVVVLNSTISGNAAGTGAGVQVGRGGALFTGDGSFSLRSSTIAGNTAETAGGGVNLPSAGGDPEVWPPVAVDSTIIAGNTAAGEPEDLHTAEAPPVARAARAAAAGGFTLGYSLVQAPANALITQSPAGSALLGVDPLLGTLADNGGPTKTLLLAATSPAIDAGIAAAGLTTDQRDLARTNDGIEPNAAGGDGTDIGAVERPATAGPDPDPDPDPEPSPAPPAATPAPAVAPPVIAPIACTSRRRVVIHVRGRFKSGTAKVAGRTFKFTPGRKRARVAINLANKAKGTYRVKLKLKSLRGRTVKQTRVYRTCRPGSTD